MGYIGKDQWPTAITLLGRKSLPPTSTPFEIAAADALARVGDVPTPIVELQDPENCPEEMLPWLADKLSVDWWNPQWTAEEKRLAILESLALHAKKGTPWATEDALRRLGYPNALVVEWLEPKLLDGSWVLNGSWTLGGDWAWNVVEVEIPLIAGLVITGTALDRIQEIIRKTKAARCRLRVVRFVVGTTESQAAGGDAAAVSHYATPRLDGSRLLDGTWVLYREHLGDQVV